MSDASNFTVARRMPRASGLRKRAPTDAQINGGDARPPRNLKRKARSDLDLPAPRSKKPRLEPEEKEEANVSQVDRCIIDLVLGQSKPSEQTPTSPNMVVVGRSRKRTRSRKDIGHISTAASVFSKRSIVNEYVRCHASFSNSC